MIVLVHFATGFEEIEGVTPVDVLRRAGSQVITVSVTGKKEVTSKRGLTIITDLLYENADYDTADVIILPGGQPGADNLSAHEGLKKQIQSFHKQEKLIAAICAAPLVLGAAGILKGKKVTCFPGVEPRLKGATSTGNMVEIDGNIVTGKSAGAAMLFSLTLVEKLFGPAKVDELRKTMFIP